MNIKPDSAEITSNGILKIGGIKVTDLVKEYGTPLYVMDVKTIRNYVHKYQSIKEVYPNIKIAFASKALSIKALYQLLDKEGMYFDVASDGELYTLIKAGVSPENAYFHGNNKSIEELLLAINNGIGTIVIDNHNEIGKLQKIIKENKPSARIKVMLRVVPEIEAHTHEFIRTGQRDTKYGFLLEEMPNVVDKILSIPELELVGLHAHIGSQIFDIDPFKVLLAKLVELAKGLEEKKGIFLQEINLGGGFGIQYTKDDDPLCVSACSLEIVSLFKELINTMDLSKEVTLVLEPGRSVVGNAGVTLYTIGAIKNIPDIRNYIAVDGGMADNPRPITYNAEYEADIATKMNEHKDFQASIAGKFCESGDVLIKQAEIQSPSIGDVLAIYGTGAYNYSMSSNYNRFRKPAMIFVENGKSQLVLKRETLDDIIRNDIDLTDVFNINS